MSEFYDDGSVKAGMIYGNYEKKPINSEVTTPIATSYKDWYDDKVMATMLLKQIQELAKGGRV